MNFFHHAAMIAARPAPCREAVQWGFFRRFELPTLPERLILNITGRTFFRVFINGVWVHYGPARAAHDFVRVDTVEVTGFVRPGVNAIAVELITYRPSPSQLSVTGEYGFLQAEIIDGDGRVIVATDAGWQVGALTARKFEVENFSHARNASEVYHLNREYESWRTAPPRRFRPASVLHDEVLTRIPREAPLPDFSSHNWTAFLGAWRVDRKTGTGAVRNCPRMVFSPDDPEGKMERPVAECVNDELLPFAGRIDAEVSTGGVSVHAAGPQWAADFDFGAVQCGFVAIEFSCERAVTLDLVAVNSFSPEGALEPRTCHSNTVIRVRAPRGSWRFESCEPMDIRYIRLIGRGSAELDVTRLSLRRCQAVDRAGGGFVCSDGVLNRIYQAARQNLVINALDCLMDCPGRERGGWATDSFWSGRAASLMFGEAAIERAHLRNFLAPSLARHFKDRLPACYPGEHDCCIQNWTIFLGLELYDYFRRTGDRGLVDECAAGAKFLVSTLSRFANRFGVLEELNEIIYVDGASASQDRYNRPISTGTNAMYCRMLKELGQLYSRADWREAAARIDRVLDEVTAIRDSGELTYLIADAFAMDPATGRITLADASSEGNQYMTAICRDLDRRKLPNYFKVLFEHFGCAPEEPLNNDIVRTLRVELLVGMMMRFELLHRHGKYAFLEREIKTLYGHMIDHGPGTLWEGWSRWSNLTHGYQSYAGAIIMRSFLGLEWIDEVSGTVAIAPHPADIRWARGFTTAKNGRIVSVDWRMGDDEFTLRVAVPEGYRAEITLPEEIYGWALQSNGRKLKRHTTRLAVSGAVVLSARRIGGK